MKNKIVILLALSLLIISCNNKNPKTMPDKTLENKSNDKTADNSYNLPPLPKFIFDNILRNADYLDVLFEDLDFSMSQDNNKAIRSFLNNINFKMTAPLKSTCKPMGNAVFLHEGKAIISANFYHSPGCYYFIFLDENDEPVYSNAMSSTGVEFFKKLKNSNFKKSK